LLSGLNPWIIVSQPQSLVEAGIGLAFCVNKNFHEFSEEIQREYGKYYIEALQLYEAIPPAGIGAERVKLCRNLSICGEYSEQRI